MLHLLLHSSTGYSNAPLIHMARSHGAVPLTDSMESEHLHTLSNTLNLFPHFPFHDFRRSRPPGSSIMAFYLSKLCTMGPDNLILCGNISIIKLHNLYWFLLLSNSTYFLECGCLTPLHPINCTVSSFLNPSISITL